MKISNKRAFYDYEITDKFEAGINLNGAEVKAIKLEHADLTGSYVRIMGSEAYLVNAKIFPYEYARPEGYQEDRTRKLLLHKKEIISLKNRTDGASLTLVPISFYDKNGLIKLEVGVGRGKKKFDKKEDKKRRDIDLEIERELASRT
jgi:SsrA-binding protein